MSNRSSLSMITLGFISIVFLHSAFGHVELNNPAGGESLFVNDVFSIQWTVAVEHDLQNWDLFYSTMSESGPWTEIALDVAAGNPTPGTVHAFDWSVPNTPSASAWVRVVQDNSDQDYDDVNEARFSISSPGFGCDFDEDGRCELNDLNALLAEGPIRDGVTVTNGVNDQFDLDGNSVIDSADVDAWLAEAGPVNGFNGAFLRADADLNGAVDVSDFNFWNENRFTATLRWDQGDFDGDGQADVSDFNSWNNNKFLSSDAASVPEPVSPALLWGLIPLAIRARQRRRTA